MEMRKGMNLEDLRTRAVLVKQVRDPSRSGSREECVGGSKIPVVENVLQSSSIFLTLPVRLDSP